MLEDRNRIALFLDVHSHSKKMGSFFYGNDLFENGRLFPFICSRMNKDILIESSDFVNDPSKKAAARLVVQNELKVRNSFTFEVSFFGRKIGKYGQHFTVDNLRGLGESLALGMFYSDLRQKDKVKTPTQPPIFKNMTEQATDSLSDIDRLQGIMMNAWNKYRSKVRSKSTVSCSSGSDSDPECFQMDEQERESLIMLEEIRRKAALKKIHQRPQAFSQVVNPIPLSTNSDRYDEKSILLEEKPKRLLRSRKLEDLVSRFSHSQ